MIIDEKQGERHGKQNGRKQGSGEKQDPLAGGCPLGRVGGKSCLRGHLLRYHPAELPAGGRLIQRRRDQ